MESAGEIVDAAPFLAVLLIALISGIPPYVILDRSGRGRARSAVAYLAGFLAGIGGTVLLAMLVGTLILAAGLFGSFVGPFLGMARAKWPQLFGTKRKASSRTGALRTGQY